MATRRKEALGGLARTESQPASQPRLAPKLPTLKTRSASQPAAPRQGAPNDEIFSIMVKRQLQLRKDLVQLRPVALPRLDGKSTPNHQEQPAQLIASMAEAVSNYGYMRRQKGEEERVDSENWPSLIQQASAAAMFAQQVEAAGPPDVRRSNSKSSFTEEACLSPFQSVVLERRRAREAKAEAAMAAAAAATPSQAQDPHAVTDRRDVKDARPPTPSYPSPFKEQPAPPPMPPEWNERLWEQRKRELAEERRRRQAERCSDPFGVDAPPKPPRVPRGVPPHGTHNAHVPPEDLSGAGSAWRPWRCPIFPNWSAKPEGRTEPTVSDSEPPEASPAAPSAAGPTGPAGPASAAAAGPVPPPGPARRAAPRDAHGGGAPGAARNSWNWGTGFFGSSKVKPLVEVPRSERAARRTQELIAQLEKEMAKTQHQSLEERKRVFKDLQRRFHPDKNLLEEESATLAFQHLMDSRASYLKGGR